MIENTDEEKIEDMLSTFIDRINNIICNARKEDENIPKSFKTPLKDILNEVLDECEGKFIHIVSNSSREKILQDTLIGNKIDV